MKPLANTSPWFSFPIHLLLPHPHSSPFSVPSPSSFPSSSSYHLLNVVKARKVIAGEKCLQPLRKVGYRKLTLATQKSVITYCLSWKPLHIRLTFPQCLSVLLSCHPLFELNWETFESMWHILKFIWREVWGMSYTLNKSSAGEEKFLSTFQNSPNWSKNDIGMRDISRRGKKMFNYVCKEAQ